MLDNKNNAKKSIISETFKEIIKIISLKNKTIMMEVFF